MPTVLKVSVVVPVYNPGAAFEECVDSLLAQTLPAHEHELIFVDDGSTDATPARLDALAGEHAHVRVSHQPNSGWPGRPRNLGMDMAEGEYVVFVDNDDVLGPEALERLHATARRDDADIVIGKVVGHGKPVPPTLFAENRAGVGMTWPPLPWLLTPHRLFRRALLDRHGLRFPEGRRRLEDHVFVLGALFRAERISVLADYPCYHWMLRDRATSASGDEFDPVEYYRNLQEVLDVVDAHTEPGPLRDRLYLRWYRGKVLSRVGGPLFANRSPEARRRRFEEIRELVAARFPEPLDARLPLVLRRRAALVRGGTVEQLEALTERERRLGAAVFAREVRAEGGDLVLRLVATVRDPAGVLRAEDGGADAGGLGEVTLQLRATGQDELFLLPAEVREHPPRRGRLELEVLARVAPATAAAGRPLACGDHVLRASVYAGGVRRDAYVTGGRRSPWLMLHVARDGTASVKRPALRSRVAATVPALRRLAALRRRPAAEPAPDGEDA